jgi:hypothetical protein
MPGERSSIMSLSTADLSRAAANVRIPGDVGRIFCFTVIVAHMA